MKKGTGTSFVGLTREPLRRDANQVSCRCPLQLSAFVRVVSAAICSLQFSAFIRAFLRHPRPRCSCSRSFGQWILSYARVCA